MQYLRYRDGLYTRQVSNTQLNTSPERTTSSLIFSRDCSEMTVQFYCPGIVGVSLLTMTWRVEWLSTGLSTG